MGTPRLMRSRRPLAVVAVLAAAVVVAVATLQPNTNRGPSVAAPGGGGPSSEPGAAAAGPVDVGNGVLVGRSYKNDRTPKALRDLTPVATKPHPEHEPNKAPKERPAVPDGGLTAQKIDSQALQSPAMPSANRNFDGIPFPGVSCNCAPPDTNGEVGLTQYVQMVNTGLQVFDKNTGGSLLGPISIVSIWSGFGGVCQSNGDGDPVVLYDQIANRWLVSQFAGAGVPTDECVAVSTTNDATGTWNRYGFHLGTNFFDYPHLAVWPDAYYMSMNVFNSSGTAFLGPQPFAFDRAAMLAGSSATFVTTGLMSSGDDAILPSDLDGSILPPAGAPNPFIMSGELSTQRIYRMHVDFVTPANTTFTLAATLTPPSFTEPCLGIRSCVPEPNGDRLDAIGDRPMFRAAYRRFADGHEALVGNQSVCVINGGNCQSPGTAVVAVRWWEIRNLTSGAPAIVQAATYQPDGTHRWMGSAAMDMQGNLAVCYTAASSSVVPGLRCAGRLAADPANSLAQGESTMFAGAGSQTSTGNRWGDYSDLTIDPVDDCTFWFTSEYYPTGSSSFNWRTRIVSFTFPGCFAGPHGTAHFTVTQCSGSALAGATVTIDGNNYGTTSASGILDATLAPGSHNWTVAKSGWTTATGSVSISDGVTTTVSTCLQSGTAHFVVTNCTTSSPLANATVTVDGNVAGQTNGSGVLDVQLTPGGHAYVITRPNYTTASGNVSVTNLQTTTVGQCLTATCTETTTFSEWWDTVTPPALPGGWSASNPQGGGVLWTTSNSGTLTPVADSAPNSAFIDDPAIVSDKLLVSPAVAISAQTAQLSFRQRASFEASWDGGVLEIKIGGGQFTDLLSAGGNFGVGGYNGTLISGSGNPIAGRQAWTAAIGSSSSFTTVTANLPASAAGQSVQFRWRMGSDVSVAGAGWRIDSVTLNDCVGTPPTTPPATTPVATTPAATTPAATTPAATTPAATTPAATTPAATTPPPGGPIAQLTGSGTTCAQFSGGTSTALTGLTYTVLRGKINTVNPSTFTYWVRVSAVAGANTKTINQAITGGNFATMLKLGSGSNVYTTACTSGLSPTFSSTAVNNTTSATVTVSFTAPAAGTYYVAVAFSTSSVRNKAVPNPTSVPYTFATTGVTGSSMPLSLHQ